MKTIIEIRTERDRYLRALRLIAVNLALANLQQSLEGHAKLAHDLVLAVLPPDHAENQEGY